MRRVFHHAVVLVAAFALAASTAAWRQCAGLQMAAMAVAQSGHSHVATDHAAMSHTGHDHMAMHGTGAPAPAADDHGCMKCCSMCTVATALLPAATGAASFTATPVMFASRSENWTGNLVAVDPGIPKRIV